MSDLFNYFYDKHNNNNYNALCSRLYGDYIDEYIHSDDLRAVVYNKQPSYEKYTTITYKYYKNLLRSYRINYTNLGHYKYINIYYLKNVYYLNVPYNIICYSLKSNKTIFINTKTKQCKIC